MPQQDWRALRIVAVLVFAVIFFIAIASGPSQSAVPGIFFLFFLLMVVVAVANAAMKGGGSRIQRPYTKQTAFPPPPPPDTVLVRCDYCMTSQPFKEKCENCGAPLPKPGFR